MERHRLWKSMSNTCYEIAVKSQPYPSGEEWLSAYARLLVGGMGSPSNDGIEFPEQFFVESYQATMKCMDILEEAYEAGEISDENREIGKAATEIRKRYQLNISQLVEGRRFCASSRKYLGWVPGFAQVGDLICIFKGGNVPFVLRHAEGDNYKLIGECYIQGIMNGEALKIGLSETKFTIC